jgi:hypothetical protein
LPFSLSSFPSPCDFFELVSKLALHKQGKPTEIKKSRGLFRFWPFGGPNDESAIRVIF